MGRRDQSLIGAFVQHESGHFCGVFRFKINAYRSVTFADPEKLGRIPEGTPFHMKRHLWIAFLKHPHKGQQDHAKSILEV